METSNIVQFLEAVDAALAEQASQGERLDLYLIGRAALILRYGLSLATKDVDMVTRLQDSHLEKIAFELFGKGTDNAKQWGLYLEGVPAGIPPIPGTYVKRAEALPGNWKALRPWQPEPHDLAVTKLKRFHAGDREDLQILCDSGDLTPEGLERALASAYFFGMDEEEDPSCKRVKENVRKVSDYLNGMARTL
jgi:hypothetical protein